MRMTASWFDRHRSTEYKFAARMIALLMANSPRNRLLATIKGKLKPLRAGLRPCLTVTAPRRPEKIKLGRDDETTRR